MPIIIYGSYGYTGQLIVEECKSQKIDVILSGRDESKLRRQSETTGFRYEAVEINDQQALESLLKKGSLVIHCAGPFKYTARAMAEACIKTKTHYTDITGEIEVFETLFKLDNQAKQSVITLLPGVGFDVVPSDCLAKHLKDRLPSATNLQLAFASRGRGLSRGTTKTMIEGLGHGGAIRKNGKIISVPLEEGITEIDYGPFKIKSVRIPWGDVSTAFYSTGIGSIEVFRGADEKLIKKVRMGRYLNWLLKMRAVKNFMIQQVNKQSAGPDKQTRESSKTYLWGKVSDGKNEKISLLETSEGYTLTAKTSVAIAKKILDGKFSAGFQTPSMAYGAELILEISGSEFKDL